MASEQIEFRFIPAAKVPEIRKAIARARVGTWWHRAMMCADELNVSRSLVPLPKAVASGMLCLFSRS